MNMRVHGFVSDEESTYRNRSRSDCTRIALDHFAVSSQPFEISAVFRIMCVTIYPAKSILSENQRLGVMRGLIPSRCPIDTETLAIHLLAIGVEIRDLTFVAHTPEEAAVFLVPQNIAEEFHAVFCDGEESVLQFRMTHRHLRRDPGHAPLEHRELSLAAVGLPIPGEVGIEAAVLVIHGAWKPDVEHVPAQ